jgi:hypothetical protein
MRHKVKPSNLSLRPRHAECHQALPGCVLPMGAGLPGQCWAGPRLLGMLGSHVMVQRWMMQRRGEGESLLHMHHHNHHQKEGSPCSTAQGLLQFLGGEKAPSFLGGPDRVLYFTAPLSAVAATASGTFNPLCKVLCILQSLYLCSIGPRSVFCLAMDTPCTSNCSPKPFYSWMQTAMPQARDCARVVRDTLPLMWAIPGPFLAQSSLTACCPLHSPQHLLDSTVANRRLPTTGGGGSAGRETTSG